MTMNLITISRKPYLAIFVAIAVLFASCEQYNQPIQKTQNQFDLSFFEQNKDNPIFKEINLEIKKKLIKLKKQTAKEKNKKVLDIVNSKTGDLMDLEVMSNLSQLDATQMLNKSLDDKMITESEFNLTNSFLNDVKDKGIDLAMSNYKEEVLQMDLTTEEFNKKNMFVNAVTFIKYKNSSLFDKVNGSKHLAKQQEGILACILATIALVAATIGLSSCVTVFLCGLAVFGFGYSFNNWMNKCVGQHSVL